MDLQALNPQQRLAAQTLEGPVLILAGAGSGKTRTLTYRLANLIDHGVAPWHILALTFTNKAAREMRERAEKLIGAQASQAWIATFHATCARILRRDIEKIGYTRSFSIYDDDDQLHIIRELLKQLGIDEKSLPPKEVRAKISDAKNQLRSPDDWLAATARDFRAQQVYDVYARYEQRLKQANALDFDDLLVKTLQLLLDHPPVLDYYRERFQYVHVDEYQDTNKAQYEFVRLITAKSRNLCVVGDDDQSIYGWRGADIRNILDFEQDYPDAVVIKLEQNYRSTANILDAANQVIAHNTGRKEKALWTDSGAGEKLKLFCAGDEREEAAWICDRIRQLQSAGKPYGGMAILYRTHAQSRVIEEMLMRAAIPYRVFGGTRFYDRKEVRDIVAYLRLIVNPADDVSLRRIINQPKRSIGETTLAELARHAQEGGMPLFSAALCPPESLSSRAAKCVLDFAHMLNRLIALKETLPLTEFVQTVLEESGLTAQYQRETTDEARERLENLQEFLGAVHEFEAQAEEATLEAYLENVALVTDLDNQENAPQYVTLMTLHSAKGLEYPYVFMAGLEEGVFPSRRSLEDENRLEEERRLCYVGITRAMRELFLSYASQRMLYNQLLSNEPSRFIAEIPKRLIDNEWNLTRKRSFGGAPHRSQFATRATRLQQMETVAQRNAYTFGTPGMGQSGALNIPGVSKGFVPSAARANASAMAELFAPGDAVLHRKFGEGTVRAVSGTGADARITIEFTAYGVKEFSLSIAPIVKLDK